MEQVKQGGEFIEQYRISEKPLNLLRAFAQTEFTNEVKYEQALQDIRKPQDQ